MADLDIIVPVHNEAESVDELVLRIDSSLSQANINYSLIFVDDYSTDNTGDVVKKYADNGYQQNGKEKVIYDATNGNGYTNGSRVILVRKKGKQGKAFSILEGALSSNAPYVAMIDGDLQYPPEALPEMYRLAQTHGVVVANRKMNGVSPLRKIGSIANILIFEKMLLGFDCDTQSGLKIFKREIIESLNEKDVTPWTLDMPLLTAAQGLGYDIGSIDIKFTERKNGQSKVDLVKTAAEIAQSTVKLKFNNGKAKKLKPENGDVVIGAGVAYRGRRFITHTHLPQEQSALQTFAPWQKIAIGAISALVFLGLLVSAKLTAIFLIAVLSLIYFIDLVFSFSILLKSLHFPPEIKVSDDEIAKLKEENLPIYSILCPLYKEANVLPQFLKAIDAIDWPENKLDVLLLLEEDDAETIQAANNTTLPSYVRVMIVPDSQPKTKPKACNYGLAYATGEYVVIYDAEDRPDPLQLKKSYIAFNNISTDIVCLQSKLNYYNTNYNLLTRLFTAEYSLWFDLILPGLQSIDTTIPLGGTSNHFKTSALRYLYAWDSFNVTEDCDLGVRLYKEGFKTGILDSVTLEEANSKVGSWLKQRSRWIKGYLQTYLVHMRDPIDFYKKHGTHSLIFQLVIGMRMVFMLINPILWLATISYFALNSLVGPAIEALYPAPIFYIAVITLIFGNFIYLYTYMIGAAKRRQWELLKFVFFVPFYWIMASIASVIALYQLVVKPHYWEKTQHGLHLAKKAENRVKTERSGQLKRLGDFASKGMVGGGALVFATMVANFSNFLYNAFLGRSVSVEEFGLVSLISSFFSLAWITASAMEKTMTHKSAYLYGKYGHAVREFWARVRRRSITISLGVSVFWLALIPLLMVLFKTDSPVPFVLFTPVWFVGLAVATDAGYLTGNLKFALLSLLMLVESSIRLSLTYVLVKLGYTSWVYAAIPASVVVLFFLGWLVAGKLKSKQLKQTARKRLSFPITFFGTSVLTNLSTIAFLSLDVVLAKIYLSPGQAGEYALLSLTGKMVFFFGTLFAQFVNPLVSREEGAERSSEAVFFKLFLATILASIVAFIGLGVFGRHTVPILLGIKTAPVLPLLPMYTFGIVCFTVASSLVGYHQVKKRYLFPVMGFLLALVQVAFITVYNDSVEAIATVISALGVGYFAITGFLHLTYDKLRIINRNIDDFIGLFASLPKERPANLGKLRILIFNWRDTKHIWAGGAEVYIHELAKRWVVEGHSVTVFCGWDGKSHKNGQVDGVNVIRRGGFYTVYPFALLYYLFHLRGNFDIVVDSENGVPFFTPLFVGVPTILLIHHVHQEVFRRYLAFPLAKLAAFIESKVTPFVYKNNKTIAVSDSTKSDLIEMGRARQEDIEVVNPGVTLPFEDFIKTPHPSFIYMGRLKPYKNIDVAIKAFSTVCKKFPDATLTVAGFGEIIKDLKKQVEKLGLSGRVRILGRVSEKEKVKLLGESWVAIQPSSFEGWGITVLEANACGTPVIASDVPGLRDSVSDGVTGILVPVKDAQALSETMEKLILDKDLRETLSENAGLWAGQFNWEKNADKFLRISEQVAKDKVVSPIPSYARVE